ncbi:membrane-tethered transcription factor [Cordyceps militaris]|uniref:Membrane-tethered transcription factor n=1 Tax=Cordyceps militaris TaxID=73501 RepID=A0A2H4SV71_CORMI|nr:membrane-tethered transcription factor [Cordyceps militaris]
MSLQLYPAPSLLLNTPFCGHNNCTHLGLASPVQAEHFSTAFTSSMDNTAPLRHNLNGTTSRAAINKQSTSPSPGVQSASIVMTASPYHDPSPSASSNLTLSSDASQERESKRPRTIRSQSGAVSGASTDGGDATEHHSLHGAHDHLNMHYSQNPGMVSQSSASMGIVTSSAMPTDTYPVMGAPYWSSSSLTTEVMDKPTSGNSDANNTLGGPGQLSGGAQSQMYGNGAAWAGHNMPMPMNPIPQYVPRRMTNGTWESELPHHHHSQQPHQQMLPDGSLASPYESSAGASNPSQLYGDCSIVNGPSHRIVTSNGYDAPNGLSTPTASHHPPGAASGWPQSAFHGPGGSMSGSRLAMAGLSKDMKPKILASSAANALRRSPVQQRATTPTKTAKGAAGAAATATSATGAAAGGGDRTTHNDVERKYRTNLKDRIAELRAAVPALQAQHDAESDGTTSNAAPKVSKGTVLSKATEYIQQLEQANRVMMSEHEQLMDRLHTLEAMLQNGGGGDGRGLPPQQQYAPNHGMAMFDPRGFS